MVRPQVYVLAATTCLNVSAPRVLTNPDARRMPLGTAEDVSVVVAVVKGLFPADAPAKVTVSVGAKTEARLEEASATGRPGSWAAKLCPGSPASDVITKARASRTLEDAALSGRTARTHRNR